MKFIKTNVNRRPCVDKIPRGPIVQHLETTSLQAGGFTFLALGDRYTTAGGTCLDARRYSEDFSVCGAGYNKSTVNH